MLRSLTAQLGLAVVNTDLYEDLQQFLAGTVKALVAAIDAKDSYTAGHSERVNIVAMLIGTVIVCVSTPAAKLSVPVPAV